MPWLPISLQPQRQQADCLVACAAMLLDYWQQPVAYDDPLKMLRIGPTGAPFRNLRYLEIVGVSVLIEQGNLDTLWSLLAQKLPQLSL